MTTTTDTHPGLDLDLAWNNRFNLTDEQQETLAREIATIRRARGEVLMDGAERALLNLTVAELIASRTAHGNGRTLFCVLVVNGGSSWSGSENTIDEALETAERFLRQLDGGLLQLDTGDTVLIFRRYTLADGELTWKG